MRGLIGSYSQRLAPKPISPPLQFKIVDDVTPGSRSIYAPFSCTARIWAWGGGGAGATGGTGCGNSGAAGYMEVLVRRHQRIDYTVGAGGSAPAATTPGNPGTATSVTVGTRTAIANGGFGGGLSSVDAAATASGFDVGRAGGVGAIQGGTEGTSGVGGGGSGNDMGGGAPGFADQDIALRGGAGGLSAGFFSADSGREPGGGGGAQPAGLAFSGAGGAGKVFILFARTRA